MPAVGSTVGQGGLLLCRRRSHPMERFYADIGDRGETRRIHRVGRAEDVRDRGDYMNNWRIRVDVELEREVAGIQDTKGIRVGTD